jgi:predicted negative regulator of RcsB-dependent stress response
VPNHPPRPAGQGDVLVKQGRTKEALAKYEALKDAHDALAKQKS